MTMPRHCCPQSCCRHARERGTADNANAPLSVPPLLLPSCILLLPPPLSLSRPLPTLATASAKPSPPPLLPKPPPHQQMKVPILAKKATVFAMAVAPCLAQGTLLGLPSSPMAPLPCAAPGRPTAGSNPCKGGREGGVGQQLLQNQRQRALWDPNLCSSLFSSTIQPTGQPANVALCATDFSVTVIKNSHHPHKKVNLSQGGFQVRFLFSPEIASPNAYTNVFCDRTVLKSGCNISNS